MRSTDRHSLVKVALLSAVALAIEFVTTRARADEPAPSDPVELRRAANRAAGDRDWSLCVKDASAAWAIQRNPSTAGILGICESETGDDLLAAEHLEFALAHDDDPARNKLTEGRLNDVRKRIATVHVSATPAASPLRVDSVAKGEAPVLVHLKPGHHQLRVSHDGYTPQNVDVDVVAGDERTVTIALTKPAQARSIVPGAIALSLGAAGILAGVGLFAGYAIEDADAKRTGKGLTCTPTGGGEPGCQALYGQVKTINLYAGVGTSLLIVGTVAAGAGTGLLVWAHGGPSKTGDASVSLAPGLGGLIVAGRY